VIDQIFNKWLSARYNSILISTDVFLNIMRKDFYYYWKKVDNKLQFIMDRLDRYLEEGGSLAHIKMLVLQHPS
jgi:hypothetical protein